MSDMSQRVAERFLRVASPETLLKEAQKTLAKAHKWTAKCQAALITAQNQLDAAKRDEEKWKAEVARLQALGTSAT